jgi:uncharacterized protein YjaZ
MIKRGILIFVGLLLLALAVLYYPMITYKARTNYKSYSIYHNLRLDTNLLKRLDEVTPLLQKSELYDSSYRLHVCLNDGSWYPKIIKTLQGDAFAWGFQNKVVLNGTANFGENNVSLNDYNWNARALIAHEAMHCYQYNKLGFWKSNPVADIEPWIWEGYAEYIARSDLKRASLKENINRLLDHNGSWAIALADGTLTSLEYYKNYILVQYCIEQKQMTFADLVGQNATFESVDKELGIWYKGH